MLALHTRRILRHVAVVCKWPGGGRTPSALRMVSPRKARAKSRKVALVVVVVVVGIFCSSPLYKSFNDFAESLEIFNSHQLRV